MKKYIFLAVFAILFVIFLQGYNILLQYKQFKQDKYEFISKALNVSIDQEYSIRAHKSYNPFLKGKQRFLYKHVSEEEVKKYKPNPKEVINVNEINVQDLRDKGIVEGEMEIFGLLAKDNLERIGRHLDFHKLDSIFIKNLGEEMPHTYFILDENKNVVKSYGATGQISDWQTSKDVAIGLKPVRFIRVVVDVPVSSFVKTSIWTLVATVFLAIFIVICITVQFVVIRRKSELLESREMSIHGTIHDLKAPLTSVLFILSYLQGKIDDENLLGLIKKAEVQVSRLSETIKGILLTAKGSEKKLSLDKTLIDVMELTGFAKDSVDFNYANKKHEIILCDYRTVRMSFLADKVLIENVMRNLLENAVKYADEGVCVNVGVYNDDKYIIVKVEDNGYGIDKKYQRQIFKQFFRVPTSHPKSGYGIGLALVKYVVESHGGRVKVESELGKGSCFTFTLPLSFSKNQ